MFLVAEVAESAEQHPFCFRFLTATVVMKGHQWRHNQRRESVPRLYADVCEVDLWALSTCTPVLAPTIWNCLWSWLAATECLWGISHYIISALSQLSISSCGPGKADIKNAGNQQNSLFLQVPSWLLYLLGHILLYQHIEPLAIILISTKGGFPILSWNHRL